MKLAPGPYLYLPIEISARELDSRLLLSGIAVDLGFEVVLGQKWLMHDNLSYMPPGVLLTKTLTDSDGRFMEVARRRGYRTASIDEEIPGLIATKQGLRWVMRNAVDAADLIFAAGADHHAALAAKFPDRRDRIMVAGNPRWDLLRPDLRATVAAEAEGLRARYGRFFLINTNLGLTNSAKGPPETIVRSLVRTGRIDMERKEDRAFIAAARQLEIANAAGIKELLRLIMDRFPDHRVVLRPHPGERLRLWRDCAGALPRVSVIREGAAAPWILACEAMIHTNCTTGVEAFALGKPAICLRPAEPPEIDIYVAPLVNPVVRSVLECIKVLQSVVGDRPFPESDHVNWQNNFDQFIAARTGALASYRIVDAIAERFYGAGLNAAVGADNPWRPKRGYRGTIRRSRSRLSLMPDVDGDVVAGRIRQWAGLLGLADNLEVQVCGDRMFHVYAGARRVPETVSPAIVALVHRLMKKRKALLPA